MSLRREGSSPSLSSENIMIETVDLTDITNMRACSSEEEQGPSKPKVAGSTPAGRDIQIAQLKLAEDVAINLIRDCPEHTLQAIRIAFSSAIEQLDL